MPWSLHLIMHVENVVPENQYIKKYMNILIAQIRKFRLLEISFIIFKYCECVPKIIIIMIMFLKGWQSTKTWLPPNQHKRKSFNLLKLFQSLQDIIYH